MVEGCCCLSRTSGAVWMATLDSFTVGLFGVEVDQVKLAGIPWPKALLGVVLDSEQAKDGRDTDIAGSAGSMVLLNLRCHGTGVLLLIVVRVATSASE